MSRVARNIVYNLIGQSLVLGLGFISVKYLYRHLGGDTVGIVYFATMASATIGMVLELGVCSTTVREIAAHHHNNPAYTREFVRVFSSLYWLLYGVAGLLIYVLAPSIVSRWLHLGTVDAPTAVVALRLLLISSLLSLPKSFYASVVRGLQKMAINNSIDTLTIGVQQLGILLIIINRGGVIQVALWIATTQVLNLAAYMAVCSRFFPVRSIFTPGYSRAIVAGNLTNTLQMAVISLTAVAYLQLDKVILSRLVPLEMFGYYYFAYSLASKGALVTMAFSYAVFPHVSSVHGAGDTKALRAHYHKLHDALCFLTVPVFAAIWFASLPLLAYLFNEPAARALAVPTMFLCLGFYMTGTLTIPNNVAFAMGRAGIVARQNCLAVLVLLPVTYICIRIWGLAGASLSIVVYGVLCYGYSIPRICAECLGMSPATWYLRVLRSYALGAATYGVAYAALRSADDLRVSSLFLAYLVSTAVMLAGTYYCIGNETQQSIAGLYASLRPRRA